MSFKHIEPFSKLLLCENCRKYFFCNGKCSSYQHKDICCCDKCNPNVRCSTRSASNTEIVSYFL